MTTPFNGRNHAKATTNFKYKTTRQKTNSQRFDDHFALLIGSCVQFSQNPAAIQKTAAVYEALGLPSQQTAYGLG